MDSSVHTALGEEICPAVNECGSGDTRLDEGFRLRIELCVTNGGDELIVPLFFETKTVSHADTLHPRDIVPKIRIRSECMSGRDLQQADGIAFREDAVFARNADADREPADVLVGVCCQGEHRRRIRRRSVP